MPLETIDSIKHPLIQTARSLATRGGRTSSGLTLAEGTRLVTQILDAGTTVHSILVPLGQTDRDLESRAEAAGVDVHPVRRGVLRHVFGSPTPPECLAIVPVAPERHGSVPSGDLTIVCDGVADPGNLGAIIRTARGLGCEGIVLTGDTDPGSRRVVEASRGAVLRVSAHRFADGRVAVTALRAEGWTVVAMDGRGERDLGDVAVPAGPVAVVVGNETEGLGAAVRSAADVLVAIGLAGDVESLNVAVAAGIALYTLRSRRPT